VDTRSRTPPDETFSMLVRPGHPDFLDLPWEASLEHWRSERVVDVERGIHRHVVRFVEYGDRLYALKELPRRLAEREYRLLRTLAEKSVPVVEAVGVVSRSGAAGSTRARRRPEPEAVLLTRHLEFSVPYRALFARPPVGDVRNRLLDALTGLLVRLHLAGFFWGDCSLSNTLFRRDAGALAAYLVDSETGELHARLSDGQRYHDVAIAEENVAGELMDLAAAAGLPEELDPVDTAAEIPRRYEQLWSELTREEIFGPEERFRIDARLRGLAELGFDVEEVELIAAEGGYRLRVNPQVVEPGHHSRRLLLLTGITAQENQARRLLHDLAGFGARRGHAGPAAEAEVAGRWLVEVYEPVLKAIPLELRGTLEPAELFHQLLEHRWFLSEAQRRDVGLKRAVASYVEHVLRAAPPEADLPSLAT
jgi:Domain of unknown function (DUF4032)/Lipopolysaccharide kinase (Kdo/WaaP) family